MEESNWKDFETTPGQIKGQSGNHYKMIWPHRLMVRTPGFHPGNLSSILGGATNLKGKK